MAIPGVENNGSNNGLGTQYNARDNAEQIKTQFMTLLVAQMKYQDPMNPVQNQDFVAQLAQFSSLEQLITINEGVEKVVKVVAPAPAKEESEES